MSKSKKAAPTTWLWISGGALILLTVLLLVSLNRSNETPSKKDRREVSDRAPRPRTRGRAVLPPPERRHVARHPPAATDAAPAATSAAPDASSATATPSSPSIRQVPTPGTHTAPAAIPAEIQQETDPARKAQLMRMHRLAIARVRASQLRRRSQLLTRSLALARKNNSWSAEKIREAEKDLNDLRRAIEIAEKNVEVTKQRLEQGR